MQLGFVIDQTRCIGCHACTVACKAENGVPLGKFRTWVKYTERGSFPEVRRSFTVLRCNQCTSAPCVTICPVRALAKRQDGIVDIDPRACIGCKACLQACPYDALYIGDDSGVAEKCHFCAHRVEVGLAPACAIVCPTEAIVPGDFDDPDSAVARMQREDGLAARKIEAGTGPNVWYRGADPAGLEPGRTTASGGSIWADRVAGEQAAADAFAAAAGPVDARTVYDVAHPPAWGRAITGYLFAKSLAAGVFLAGLPLLPPLAVPAAGAGRAAFAVPLVGLAFLALTSVLLVADLKRPERFWFILARPNMDSWLARGTFALAGYGAALAAWLALAAGSVALPRTGAAIFAAATAALAALAAGYTGWLFGQAKGRVLWMRRGLAAHLVVQAVVAGAAVLLLLASPLGLAARETGTLRALLVASLAAHLVFVIVEKRLAPRRREAEYDRASRLLLSGPYARAHSRAGIGLGIAVPFVLLVFPAAPLFWAAAGALALVGLWVEEDLLVRAGQAPAIS